MSMVNYGNAWQDVTTDIQHVRGGVIAPHRITKGKVWSRVNSIWKKVYERRKRHFTKLERTIGSDEMIVA